VRDLEIRAELHRQIRGRHGDDPSVRVVDEMGVLTGERRIDVAVINGHLEGFEIKSERDSLDRLPRQAAAYGRVFDRLTVICAERHLDKAMACLPVWWGIDVARPNGTGVRIAHKRLPKANRELDPRAIAQLLWRQEALDALEELGCAKGLRSKPRRVLWQALAEALAPRDLRTLVRERLRTRRGWLADC
jgi:hypothetical protein